MTSPHSQSEDNPNGVAPVPSEQHVPWRSNPTPQEQPTPVQQVPHLPPVGWRPGYRQEPQELGYHRLALADPKSRWWKPPGEIIIWGFLLLLTGIIPYTVVNATSVDRYTMEYSYRAGGMVPLEFFTRTLWAVGWILTLVAAVAFSLWIARLCMGAKPRGLILSVEGRMRWGWLMTCCGLAAATAIILVPIFKIVSGYEYGPSTEEESTVRVALLMGVVFVIPAYTFVQELVLRGLYMQAVGRCIKHPALAIILSAVVYVFLDRMLSWAEYGLDSLRYGGNDIISVVLESMNWELYFMMILWSLAVTAAANFITWYTGGIEASFALHTVLYMVITVSAIYGPSIDIETYEWTNVDLLSFSIVVGVFVLIVALLAKQKKIARTRPAQVWVKEQPVPSPAPVR